MEAKQSNYIRVGIFVLAGLVVLGALIFIIGEERQMFSSKIVLHTTFRDVGGLRVGSPVRMGGVNIGSVTSVRFATDPRDTTLHVDFEITSESFPRVRANSIAQIGSKGLLGDKALDITIGDPNRPAVANGATIVGENTDDMGAAIRNAGVVLERASTVMENVATATRPLANPQLGNDIVAMAHSLRTVTESIATGNGTASRLLRDEALANEIQSTLASARGTMQNLENTSAQVQALARDARNGRGLVHALVYDEQGGRAVNQFAAAANELAGITRDVRTGNGGLHQVIYGDDLARTMQNLNETTSTARTMMADLQRGRGTLGALLVDPSLYEDIKSLVGNVSRNEILRAMVRYSIHANEHQGQGVPAVEAAESAQQRANGGRGAGASAMGTTGGGAR